MTSLSPEKAKEISEFWKESSKDDLETSRIILFQGQRFAPSLFFLHLSLEKALKSFFVVKFLSHAPYTHNLLSLIEKLEWPLDEVQKIDFSEINQFNTMGRYPDLKANIRAKFTKEFSQEHFQKGEALWTWIFTHSERS